MTTKSKGESIRQRLTTISKKAGVKYIDINPITIPKHPRFSDTTSKIQPPKGARHLTKPNASQ